MSESREVISGNDDIDPSNAVTSTSTAPVLPEPNISDMFIFFYISYDYDINAHFCLVTKYARYKWNWQCSNGCRVGCEFVQFCLLV